jgi:hypothetical protein
MFLKNVFFIVAPTGAPRRILVWLKLSIFCPRSFEKTAYLLRFTYLPDIREKNFLFSDAWAIA